MRAIPGGSGWKRNRYSSFAGMEIPVIPANVGMRPVEPSYAGKPSGTVGNDVSVSVAVVVCCLTAMSGCAVGLNCRLLPRSDLRCRSVKSILCAP